MLALYPLIAALAIAVWLHYEDKAQRREEEKFYRGKIEIHKRLYDFYRESSAIGRRAGQ